MGREYGVQLAKEALKILEEDPLNISTALGELLVGQFEDFEVGNYLTIKELYPAYLNSNKLLNLYHFRTNCKFVFRHYSIQER